jgi:hypothetical protein
MFFGWLELLLEGSNIKVDEHRLCQDISNTRSECLVILVVFELLVNERAIGKSLYGLFDTETCDNWNN